MNENLGLRDELLAEETFRRAWGLKFIKKIRAASLDEYYFPR